MSKTPTLMFLSTSPLQREIRGTVKGFHDGSRVFFMTWSYRETERTEEQSFIYSSIHPSVTSPSLNTFIQCMTAAGVNNGDPWPQDSPLSCAPTSIYRLLFPVYGTPGRDQTSRKSPVGKKTTTTTTTRQFLNPNADHQTIRCCDNCPPSCLVYAHSGSVWWFCCQTAPGPLSAVTHTERQLKNTGND